MTDTTLPITNTVTDDEGNAVEGAHVALRRIILDGDDEEQADIDRYGDTLAETTTDANGVYSFDEDDLPTTYSAGGTEEIYWCELTAVGLGPTGNPIQGDGGRARRWEHRPWQAYALEGDIPDTENLHAHYDAQQQDTLLNNGSPVSDGESVTEWQDASGNGNHLTGGNPTYSDTEFTDLGGESGVVFDGVDDEFTVSFGTTLTSPYTVYLVYRTDEDVLSTDNSFYYATDHGSREVEFGTQIGDEDAFSHNAQSDRISSDTTTNNPHWTVNVHDGSNSYIERNDGGSESGNAGPEVDMTDLLVGVRQDRSQYVDGPLGEALFYDARHDSSTRQEVIEYIEGRWGF